MRYLFCIENNERIGLEDLVDDFVTFYSAGKRYNKASNSLLVGESLRSSKLEFYMFSSCQWVNICYGGNIKETHLHLHGCLVANILF